MRVTSSSASQTPMHLDALHKLNRFSQVKACPLRLGKQISHWLIRTGQSTPWSNSLNLNNLDNFWDGVGEDAHGDENVDHNEYLSQ